LFVWDSTDAEKCYPSIRTLCMFSKWFCAEILFFNIKIE
jgi:hypothetical protein